MSIRSRIRQRYGRFRKHRFFSFVAVFLIIILLSGSILAALGIFGSRAELCTIKMADSTNYTQSLSGLGINLDNIPINNIIHNGSFESKSEFSSFHIKGATEDKILTDIDDALSLGAGDVVGSNLRVYSIDESGNLNNTINAQAISYNPANFSTFEEIEDSNWFWTQDGITKIISSHNVISGITTEGFLISDMDSSDLSVKYAAENDIFTDICANSEEAFAVTKNGTVYYSSDGKVFSKMTTIEVRDLFGEEDGVITCEEIATVSNEAVIRLSNGKLVLVSGKDTKVLTGFESDVIDIINTEKEVYVFLADGSAFTSFNGLVYKDINGIDEVMRSRNIKKVSAADDQVGVLLEGGSIVIIEDNGFYTNEVSSDVKDLCIIDGFKMIIISSNNTASILERGTVINLDNDIEGIFRGENEKYYVLRGSNIYRTDICSSFQIDHTVTEGAVFPGDLCYIEKTKPSCSFSIPSEVKEGESQWALSDEAGSWDTYGLGTIVSASEGAPSGYGKRCARLMGISDNVHVLSQKIADKGEDIFNENDFLRMELWLCSEEALTVKVWLSSDGCKDIGFVIDESSDHFTDYSNVFVASKEMLQSEKEIRFNIAFEGEGELKIDGVYLGLDKYSSVSMPDEFKDSITASSPNVIRLNNLGFGSSGFCYASFFSLSSNSNTVFYDEKTGYVNNCSSLEDSLRLVKDSNAYPWLVMGSYVSSDSINTLLEYMCGPVSSTLGKIRIDNGTAVPWSRQLNKFIVEINDSDNVFKSDIQRSAYVNFVISLIKQSDYYNEFKDKIVFLDGMNYEGGNMLSNADAHCCGYVSDSLIPSDQTYIEYMSSNYVELNTNTPRVNSYGADTGEFIASLDVISGFGDSDITAGKCLVSLLSRESIFSSMILTDIDAQMVGTDYADMLGKNNETMLSCLNIVNSLSYSRRLNIEIQKPLSKDSPYDLATFQSQVGTYLFKTDDGFVLIIANASDSQQQFLIDAPNLNLKGSTITRYSNTGKELQTSTNKGRHPRYTLQAGQVMTVEIKTEKSS